MNRHRELSERVYFATPHNSWQYGRTENANRLIREYLLKGTYLSVYSKEQHDEIAQRLSTIRRKVWNYKIPAEVLRDQLQSILESRGVKY